MGYKKVLVETRRQGIPTVLQSKFDIAPLFMHRNLWRYIEGGDKLKCSKMNFFSQTLIGATLRCDCIGPNRTNSLHTSWWIIKTLCILSHNSIVWKQNQYHCLLLPSSVWLEGSSYDSLHQTSEDGVCCRVRDYTPFNKFLRDLSRMRCGVVEK